MYTMRSLMHCNWDGPGKDRSALGNKWSTTNKYLHLIQSWLVRIWENPWEPRISTSANLQKLEEQRHHETRLVALALKPQWTTYPAMYVSHCVNLATMHWLPSTYTHYLRDFISCTKKVNGKHSWVNNSHSPGMLPVHSVIATLQIVGMLYWSLPILAMPYNLL